MKTRQAVMKVSRELLEELMPDWQTRARARYGDMVDDRLPKDVEAIAGPYHLALKLPANCRITGISADLLFLYDQIAFRIESPDFVETKPGSQLPSVNAVYHNRYEFNFELTDEVQLKSATGYFLRWDGPAVETCRTYGPAGKEVRVEAVSVGYGVEKGIHPVVAETAQLLKPRSLAPGEKLKGADGYALPEGSEAVLKELKEKGVLEGKPVSIFPCPCWRCQSPTSRCLPDGVAECRDCAEKSLL